MFDVARALALLWALLLMARTRAWLELAVLFVVVYLFGLEIASGFTIRSEGPQEPTVALLLALIGPSAMPRGHLPSFPLAGLVVHWPALTNVLAGAALFVTARRAAPLIDALPQFSEETRRLQRIMLSVYLLAVFEGVSAGTRVLPVMLDWGAGGQIFDHLPD